MSDPTDLDPVAYINRVRAEIEADAETMRRRDPELARRERDLERAWVDVAPPGAAGGQRELLLDRADRLSMIDVDAPLGARPGVRHVKGAIRKGTYWYLRYVTDQVNALTNVLVRLLRRLDERLTEVEGSLGLADTDAVIDPPPDPSAAGAEAIAAALPDGGSALVLSCGSGAIVRAARDRGLTAVGIDRDAVRILPGVKDGLDLRTGDPARHLDDVPDDSLDGLVLTGFVEDLAPAAAWTLLDRAARVLRPGAVLVIAAADPADRDTVERDLRHGRGLAPATWRHLLERAGATTDEVTTPDARLATVVVGRFS